jgi:antitoxin ParD1/3/4
MATNVHLTPELEEFARACVETGRYNNVSEVMRAGLRLLQEREDRRRAFAKMLTDAEAEAESEGTYTIDEVAAELDAIIAGKV